MGSFLSQPASYGATIDTTAIDLFAKVSQAKEQKFDANQQQLQNTLDQYGNISSMLVRQQDKDYLAQKLAVVSDIVNNSGNRDLSRAGVTRNLQSQIKNVVNDKKVLDSIEDSQKYIGFQKQVAQIQDKNKDGYSDTNYAFALEQAGFNDWYGDETGTKRLGNLKYSPFVDVTKTTLAKIKDFKDLKGDETIEVQEKDSNGTPTGRLIKKSVKGLTESEILAYLPNIMSSEENKQLQINGWAKYQGEGGLQLAQKQFTDYTKNVYDNLDENIKNYHTAATNTNLSEQERKEAAQKETAETERKKQFQNSYDTVDINSTAALGGFLESTSWKTNFAKLAGAKVSQEYETDQAYFNSKNLELAYAKEAREQEKQPYELAKLKREAGILEPNTPGTVSLTTVPVENQDEVQPYNSLVKDFNTQTNEIKNIVAETIVNGGLDQNTKYAYAAAYKQNIADGLPASTAAKNAFEKAGIDRIFPEKHAQLIEMESRKNAMGNVIIEANKAKQETFLANPDKYLANAEGLINYSKNEQQKSSGYRELFDPLIRAGWVSDFQNPAGSPEVVALRNFAAKNGGTKGLKEKLTNPKNTALLEQFSNLLDKANKSLYISGDAASINDDSKSTLNRVVIDKGQGVVTTADIATVTNPAFRKKIIEAIPQSDGVVPFDPNGGITLKRGALDGTIDIIQSGTKEGVKGIFGSSRVHTVKRGDDLYNVINSQLQSEAERRGVSAQTHNTPIKNGNINYLDSQQKSLVNKAATFIQATTGNAVMASKVSPTYYLTKDTTNQVYTQKLPNVPQEKINALTELMTNDTFNKFEVQAIPVNGQWTTRVSIKKGGVPLLLAEADTGKTNMDKDLLLYVKQYPQILIGEALLEYLQQTPEKIDEILQRLK